MENTTRIDRLEEMMYQVVEGQKKATESTIMASENTSIMAATINSHTLLINGLNNSINSLQETTNVLSGKIEVLEYSSEIKTEQVNSIRETANKRIISILGEGKKNKEEIAYEIEKYYRKFIVRLYTDAKKFGGLGNKIETTKKGNFQRVIDYIEAWNPSEGCAKMKEYCDQKAVAKTLAKMNGYVA